MQSMTGIGIGEALAGDTQVTVELRSVNHRFLDVAMKLPSAVAGFEIDVRNVLKERLLRGRVTCAVSLERGGGEAAAAVSPAAVDRALRTVELIADRIEAAGAPRPAVTVQDVLAVPDLFRGEAADADAEALRAALLRALEGACDRLLEMKRTEGAETANDLRKRLDAVATQLEVVKARVPAALQEAQARLTERLNALLGESLEPQRLAQEAAILVDKGNINEECERLASHLEQTRAALAEGGAVAKRLNFLLQEMHREVNTMGSKTQTMDITNAVIAMKEEVESMREQVMNLE
ncbi:MAG TPA: YicC family protein [Candidatus Krumholzibacteria bacterium]|nr:YicC family protein [Candidatus Krumholzibacteria bacterium]HRX50794.1 YicC family protein [Candidatus Krumholzibacteria bacterium]